MMRNREWLWGFCFLLSAIFVVIISIWKYIVYLEASYIILFQWWEIIFFIYAIIVTLIAIGGMIRSFYYARRDLTDQKTVSWYIKVIVIVSVFYYAYNIYLVIDVILRW
ncbi:MAG: hypothetical protein ACFFAA_02450 [Promethearchaeota archaeon]